MKRFEGFGFGILSEIHCPPADTLFGNTVFRGDAVNCPSSFQMETDNLFFKFRSITLWHNMYLFSLQNDYILISHYCYNFTLSPLCLCMLVWVAIRTPRLAGQGLHTSISASPPEVDIEPAPVVLFTGTVHAIVLPILH